MAEFPGPRPGVPDRESVDEHDDNGRIPQLRRRAPNHIVDAFPVALDKIHRLAAFENGAHEFPSLNALRM